MKSNVFVARMARNAVLSTLAGVCLMPQAHVGLLPQPLKATDTTTPGGNRFEEPETITSSANVIVSIPQNPKEWTKANEKEFRALTLKEATGAITRGEMRRLNWLSRTRDHCLSPLSTEEVLLQIRRDRILEKLADVLQEYVEFNRSTGQKGTTT
jgi:hypothetical protein